MDMRRSIIVLAATACSVALLAACGGGTSSGDKTKTAAAGGAEASPVATITAVEPTAAALPTVAAATSQATPGTAQTPSAGGGESVQLQIEAPDDTKYDKNTLNASAGAQVTLTFTNNSDLPHDWHVFSGNDASAPSLAQTQIKTGPNDTETVSFTAPTQAGKYYFQCDVHPAQMNGFLVVQ